MMTFLMTYLVTYLVAKLEDTGSGRKWKTSFIHSSMLAQSVFF